MGQKHKVATTDELPQDGDRTIVEVEGVEIALFRHDGSYHALLNYCVHQGGPLCEGDVSGRTVVGDNGWEYIDEDRFVRCPWHGWMFDITDGRCVDSEKYRTPTFEVEVEDGDIFVRR